MKGCTIITGAKTKVTVRVANVKCPSSYFTNQISFEQGHGACGVEKSLDIFGH